MYSNRNIREIAFIDAKRESLMESIKSLDSENMINVSKIIEIKNLIRQCSSNIDAINFRIIKDNQYLDSLYYDEILKEIQNLEYEYTIKKKSLLSLNEKMVVQSKRLILEKERLPNWIRIANSRIQSLKNPSPFLTWKNLSQKCSILDSTHMGLIEKHEISVQIQIVFEQTLNLIAERQESIEDLKTKTKSEKAMFQEKLLQCI